MSPPDFCAFILTNGRPDKVFTYDNLKRFGYTGPIYLLVDNQDKTLPEYKKKYGDQVIVFDKNEIAKTFDQGDNFQDMRAIIYARNACFKIAAALKFKYFIQLDDDYKYFLFRFDNHYNFNYKPLHSMDRVLTALLDFYKKVPQLSALAFAQGGDFIGGEDSSMAEKIKLKRKCMNSFICSTERPFKFQGRINEDVNTYTHQASKGLLMLTTNQVSLLQLQTQTNTGGMTELYLDSGTYVKSFYSVMYQPSSVRVGTMSGRLHHKVNWKCTVPKILAGR